MPRSLTPSMCGQIEALGLKASRQRRADPRGDEVHDAAGLVAAVCRSCGSDGLEMVVIVDRGTGARKRHAECVTCEVVEPL